MVKKHNPPKRLKHPKTGHEAIAVLPREVVTLKAAGYHEVKKAPPAPPKPVDNKN